MKKYLLIISLLFLIFSSCEEPDNNDNTNIYLEPNISIIFPQNNDEIIYSGTPIKVMAMIENKEFSIAASISINDSINIIASGLSDTLIAYYEPQSGLNEMIDIIANLTYDDVEGNIIGISDNITVSINTLDSNTLSSELVFMDIIGDCNPSESCLADVNGDGVFQMMRFPVTNQQFVDFLNSNPRLDVQIGEILHTNTDGDQNGDPANCEIDPQDNYEPLQWWHVSVSSDFGNENVPADSHIVYRNADNPYDSNADFSGQSGKIKFECENGGPIGAIYPNGDEIDTLWGMFEIDEEYMNHPATGVTWIGANVYANYFGWRIPTFGEWRLAARGDSSSWLYPWGNEIDETHANYNNTITTEIGKYNGVYNEQNNEEYNLSLSAFGLYDMGGNVWEYIDSITAAEAYIKTGGAFDSDTTQIEIGSIAYSLLGQTSNNTGFRCVTDNIYMYAEPSGCMTLEDCNYDAFAELPSDCFQNDCFGVCGGSAQLYTVYQDLDNDGFGNPNVSEEQCEYPQDGWCTNSDDKDDNCYSETPEQDNIDCSYDQDDEETWEGACEGSAFIDGCGNCVGGNTGEEECSEDCNGDLNGGAYWDDCGYCVGGNTELEENYADVGCGCDEDAAEYYCEDIDGNDCCDCVGSELDGGWENCDLDTDVHFLCQDEVEAHINLILGCSNEYAENYYCNEDENECIQPGLYVIPPCNFIDDGSCVVHGCSDTGCEDWSPYPGLKADNYWEEATICDDGSLTDCCNYAFTESGDVDYVTISFGSVTTESMEILIDTPHNLLGFQFEILGTSLGAASGGIAEENGFMVQTGGTTVLGFSFTGDLIPSGSSGVLTTIGYTPTADEACLELGETGAFPDENQNSLSVRFGNCDCHEF